MQLWQNLTTLLSLIELSSIGQQFAHIVQNICEATATEQDTRTFIYLSSDGASSDKPNVPLILQKLRMQNPIAVINIDAHAMLVVQSTANYRDQFNHNLLSIVQLTSSENAARDEQLLLSLWQHLHRHRKNSLILLFADDTSEEYVTQILQFCGKQRAINVIALQPRMAVRERSYHTLEIFPIQKAVKRNFSSSYRAIFSNQLENMHGQPLRLFETKWYPQIYNYTPKSGPVALSGFIGRALVEYTKRRNGTIGHIQFSQSGNFIFSEAGSALAKNIADVAPIFPIPHMYKNLSLSDAVYYASFGLMVPVENPLPKFTFYYIIIKKSVFVLFCFTLILISCIVSIISRCNGQRQIPLADYFIKFSMLQGLLGMPFWTSKRTLTILKFICIIISLAGIIIGTAYGTFLESFIVDAPLEQYVKNIGDLLKRGIKVAGYSASALRLHDFPNFANYTQNVTLFQNLTELLALQDTLDTRYAFIVSDMWTIYNEQQKYFSRPLFRLSDIGLSKDTPMGLPLQKYSIFYEDLNQFFSKLFEAGLISYWLRHSFVELVEMGLMRLENRNKKLGFEPLKLTDLHEVFAVMGVLIILSIFCYVLEMFGDILRRKK